MLDEWRHVEGEEQSNACFLLLPLCREQHRPNYQARAVLRMMQMKGQQLTFKKTCNSFLIFKFSSLFIESILPFATAQRTVL